MRRRLHQIQTHAISVHWENKLYFGVPSPLCRCKLDIDIDRERKKEKQTQRTRKRTGKRKRKKERERERKITRQRTSQRHEKTARERSKKTDGEREISRERERDNEGEKGQRQGPSNRSIVSVIQSNARDPPPSLVRALCFSHASTCPMHWFVTLCHQ